MRFKSPQKALSYYKHFNPARQKRVNVLERERQNKRIAAQFSGDHPADVWASIILAIKKTLKPYDFSHRYAFNECELREDRRHPDDVAKELLCSPRAVMKMVRRVMDDLETELRQREVLEYKD